MQFMYILIFDMISNLQEVAKEYKKSLQTFTKIITIY